MLVSQSATLWFLPMKGGAVAALAQDLREHRDALGDLAAVARVGVAHLGDDAGAGGVMVAPGEQGCAGRRAKRGGVEARVAQPRPRQAIEVGRGDLSAERAPLAESRVVDEDEQDVRGA